MHQLFMKIKRLNIFSYRQKKLIVKKQRRNVASNNQENDKRKKRKPKGENPLFRSSLKR